MNPQFHVVAREAEDESRGRDLQWEYALGILGRFILAGAGLVVGAVLGLIAGLCFGLIQIAC